MGDKPEDRKDDLKDDQDGKEKKPKPEPKSGGTPPPCDPEKEFCG